MIRREERELHLDLSPCMVCSCFFFFQGSLGLGCYPSFPSFLSVESKRTPAFPLIGYSAAAAASPVFFFPPVSDVGDMSQETARLAEKKHAYHLLVAWRCAQTPKNPILIIVADSISPSIPPHIHRALFTSAQRFISSGRARAAEGKEVSHRGRGASPNKDLHEPTNRTARACFSPR